MPAKTPRFAEVRGPDTRIDLPGHVIHGKLYEVRLDCRERYTTKDGFELMAEKVAAMRLRWQGVLYWHARVKHTTREAFKTAARRLREDIHCSRDWPFRPFKPGGYTIVVKCPEVFVDPAVFEIPDELFDRRVKDLLKKACDLP